MKQTFTIAGSLALVSLFGIANAGYAQTAKSDVSVKAGQKTNLVVVKTGNKPGGSVDIQITENGKTRKLTGVKSGTNGKIEIPSGNGSKSIIIVDAIDNGHVGTAKVVKGMPLVMPSGVASTQAHAQSVSVKASGNGSGTFDVEITENGKTRKLTGLKPEPNGRIEIPSGVKGHPPIVIDAINAHGNVNIKVGEALPLVMPSGMAGVQAHSSSVSVNAVGNGSGTFDVEITENGKTRKLTGLTPGAKGFIEIPSGPHGEATIVIDPNGPQGGANIKVEGQPLILPSGAAAAQAHSRNVTVKAVGNGSGTFDVEITEDGKTRKLTGVKSKPDGTLDIPELNDAAPAGATISKQVKIINGTSNLDSVPLPTIIDGFKNDDVKVILNGAEISGAAGNVIAPGTAVTVTTDGLAGVGEILHSGRVVAGHPLTEPYRVELATAHQSKEVLIEAKLVKGKKVVAAPKITVMSGQKASIQAGDVWMNVLATVSPAGTVSLKGDAGSAKATKGPGFSVSGLASGGTFNYANGAAGTWEIKATLSGAPTSRAVKTIIMKSAKP